MVPFSGEHANLRQVTAMNRYGIGERVGLPSRPMLEANLQEKRSSRRMHLLLLI
jgi:hypothetical protein